MTWLSRTWWQQPASTSKGQTVDYIFLSVLANCLATPFTAGVSPSKLTIACKMCMPLDLLSLKPPKRRVHFTEVVENWENRQQDRYKRYADEHRRAKPSRIEPGDKMRFRLQNRGSKLDPVWRDHNRVISKLWRDTVRFNDGKILNAQQLKDQPTAEASADQPSSIDTDAESAERPVYEKQESYWGERSGASSQRSCRLRRCPDKTGWLLYWTLPFQMTWMNYILIDFVILYPTAFLVHHS